MRRSLIALSSLLIAGGVITPPAQAVSPDVVISQVYGGGGLTGAPYTHDFVELFNRGTSAVSLAGMSVQYASATGTGNFASNPVLQLSGTLQPGQYYLAQMSGGMNGSPLPTPDVTGTTVIASGSGKVALIDSTTGLACNGGSTPCSGAQLALIRDLVGYGTANFFEGSAPAGAPNITTGALRLANGCTDTDENGADVAVGPPVPRNSGAPLAPCGFDAAPTVVSVSPADGTSDVAPDANLSVTFSEPVVLDSGWFTLSCSATGAPQVAVSGCPSTFSLDPAEPFRGGETCKFVVRGDKVHDQDAVDPLDTMTGNVAAEFAVRPDPVVTPPPSPTQTPAVDPQVVAKAAQSFSAPKKLKKRGVTVLTAKGAKTSAGLPVTTTVETKGKVKVIRKKGAVKVRAFGKKGWRVIVTQTAPGTDTHEPFSQRVVYVNGKRR